MSDRGEIDETLQGSSPNYYNSRGSLIALKSNKGVNSISCSKYYRRTTVSVRSRYPLPKKMTVSTRRRTQKQFLQLMQTLAAVV